MLGRDLAVLQGARLLLGGNESLTAVQTEALDHFRTILLGAAQLSLEATGAKWFARTRGKRPVRAAGPAHSRRRPHRRPCSGHA